MDNLTDFYKYIDTTIFKDVMTNILTITILNETKIKIFRATSLWAILIETKNTEDMITFNFINNTYLLKSEIIVNSMFEFESQPSIETTDQNIFYTALEKLLEEL